MKIRKRLNSSQATKLNLKVKPNLPNRNQAWYYITSEQWELVRDERKFYTTQQKKNKDGDITSSVEKLQDAPIDVPENHEIVRISTNKTTGQQWVITKPKADVESVLDVEFITEVVKKHIKPVNYVVSSTDSKLFDRLIYTDCHIGMTPDESGFALYGGKWDEKKQIKAVKYIVDKVIANQKGDLLIIDDLGDFLDGWNGETVRKGHKLPQNMDNRKMFDVGLNFKVSMIDMLVEHYSEIQVNNICEDNHAGSFGYIVNSAFKQIVELKYSNVRVINHRKFINHYFIGKHAFVISHGKDSHALKFGFKPFLDPKQIEKIDQYLKQFDVYKKAKFIEFSKGDSHQMLFDFASSDDFDYCNYPSLAPSSEWVQTNYKKGRSGFVIQNISFNKNEKDIKPYYII